jgi:hypothetical protein
MPDPRHTTTNYRRGADLERRAKHELLEPRPSSPALFRSDRWFAVTRVAGSKGPWDLVALGEQGALVLSVKRVASRARARRLLGSERRRLTRLALPPYARAAVVCWVRGYGWLTSGLVSATEENR